MVTKEFLNLIDLFEAQTLYVYELPKIIVLDEYKNFMLDLFR